MKKTSPLFLFLTILIIINTNSFTLAQDPNLSLTITTSKPSYYIGEYVYIYGNLTENGTLIQDGLVALQVNGPLRIMAVRTLVTNVTPTDNWLITVTDLVPCDQYGNPKQSFTKGTLSYFNVTVTNNDIEMRQVLVTVSIYDSSQAPLGVASFKGIVQQNSSFSVIMSVPISNGAATGTGTAYANAYSDWPEHGGKAYCPEKSSTFQILSKSAQASATILNGQEGNYNTTFKLSFEELLGTYTVYVTSLYQYATASNSTQFVVSVQGDANGDGVVDGSDFFILLQAWGTTPPSDPSADFNNDGTVDGSDFFILLQNWGYGA